MTCKCPVWEGFEGAFMCFDPECPRQVEYLTALIKANNPEITKQEELEIEAILSRRACR